MRFYGKYIQRFELHQVIHLGYDANGNYTWLPGDTSNDPEMDQVEVTLHPSTFTLDSVYISEEDLSVNFDYVDDRASDIQPEFEITDLRRLGEAGIITFTEDNNDSRKSKT